MGPRFELIELCWSFLGLTERPISCAIGRVDGPGVEVRVGYSIEEPMRIKRVPDMNAARELATQWRQALLDKGFEELKHE